jgi:hypothetical protein
MTPDPIALPQPGRPVQKILLLLAVTILVMASWGVWKWRTFMAEWERLGPLEPAGGLFFEQKVELAVPSFRQADDRWRNDILGSAGTTLAAEGCAVSSAAMVLAYYGAATDPGQLNRYLTENAGYTPQGWIYWEKAAEITGGAVRHAYESDPSYRHIDENLRMGNPVIVRVRAQNGISHFVVIAGKNGYDYLTRDPGAGASKGMYPLREFGSKIEALRYYVKVAELPKTTPKS